MIDHNKKQLDQNGLPLVNSDYVWNKRLHFPLITKEYLAAEYFIQYEAESGNDEAQTNQDFRDVLDISYLLCTSGKSIDNRKAFIYLVAKDSDILYQVLGLQAQIIKSYLLSGAPSDFYDNQGQLIIPPAIQTYVTAHKLDHQVFNIRPKTEDGSFPEGVDY